MPSRWICDTDVLEKCHMLPRACWITLLTASLILTSGCVEIPPFPAGSNDGVLPDDGEDGDLPGEGDASDIPVAILSVLNPTPQLNEEVSLRCSIAGEDPGDTTFDFQPDNGRLLLNNRAGTASFIVEEADIGSEFVFTCTATNSNGTSRPSAEQVIIPTAF